MLEFLGPWVETYLPCESVVFKQNGLGTRSWMEIGTMLVWIFIDCEAPVR